MQVNILVPVFFLKEENSFFHKTKAFGAQSGNRCLTVFCFTEYMYYASGCSGL